MAKINNYSRLEDILLVWAKQKDIVGEQFVRGFLYSAWNYREINSDEMIKLFNTFAEAKRESQKKFG